MRDWQLSPDAPLALRLAADARLGGTDYVDDQVWELVMAGGGDAPAFALQTSYGGRCKLVRLVPTWTVGGRSITQAQGYAERPVLRAFAPNYLRASARPVPELELTAEFWAMSSHVVGGRWTFANTGDAPVEVDAELAVDAAPNRPHDRRLKVRSLDLEGGPVLEIAGVGNINPVVALKDAAEAGRTSLIRPVTVPPGERATLHWVHVGVGNLVDAVVAINHWLFDTDWDQAFSNIAALSARIPDIRTGDPEWDAALALSYKVALGCYAGPTGSLPHPSFVFVRTPEQGYSATGDGTDYSWLWDGQVATEAYVNLPAIAPAAPELAKGVIRNWLAVQTPDGWIDWKPGLAGQRNERLAMPLLATTAWTVYQYDEERSFVAEVFPGLMRFFERWFESDMDADCDGLPEWTDTIHSAFDDCPTFVRWRRWGQGADIRKYECPDLGAYLYREAASLREMAVLLDNVDARAALDARMTHLAEMLSSMWRDESASYHYRDRDTHLTVRGVHVGTCKGGEEIVPALELDAPNRVLIRATGGADHVPEATAYITGLDADGQHAAEALTPADFYWYRGLGTATSAHVYRRVDTVRMDGLSRVYEVDVSAVDTTRIDQTLLLPLWARLPGRWRARAMVQNNITNPDRFFRTFGMPNCPADDPSYDPTNRDGSGGVWMMWNTMLGEALIDYGFVDESVALFTRIMNAILNTLKTGKAFREAYNPDAPEGIGAVDYIWGVVPLHWFMRLAGVRIVSPRKVWVGGRYALPWPVTIRHRDVEVTRSAVETKVTFPSGAAVALTGAAWQAVEDPGTPAGS